MLLLLSSGRGHTRSLCGGSSEVGSAVLPLPTLSVLFARFGSDSAGVAVAVLSNAPAAVIVAVTLMVTFAPEARLAMVQGKAAQPPPAPFGMVRVVGVAGAVVTAALHCPACS